MPDDTAEILALARAMQEKIEEACPDQNQMKMRAAVLLVGEAYLQSAALEKVVNDLYRKPSGK